MTEIVDDSVPQPTRRELTKPLADRMAEPIEEAASGISMLLGAIVRKSLRSGLDKLDAGLESTVDAKVDESIRERTPELEDAVRTTARGEVLQQLEDFRKAAKETGTQFWKRIEKLQEELERESVKRQNLAGELGNVARDAVNRFTAEIERLGKEVSSRIDEEHAAAEASRQKIVESIHGKVMAIEAEVVSGLSQLRTELGVHAEKAGEQLVEFQEEWKSALAKKASDLQNAFFSKLDIFRTEAAAETDQKVDAVREQCADNVKKASVVVQSQIVELRSDSDRRALGFDERHKRIDQTTIGTREILRSLRETLESLENRLSNTDELCVAISERIVAVEDHIRRPGAFAKLAELFTGKKKSESKPVAILDVTREPFE